MSLDDIAVAAHFTKRERNSSLFSFATPTLSSLIFSSARAVAFLNDLIITLGWTPSSTNGLHCFKNSPKHKINLRHVNI